jgi:hypothetical protein
VTRGRFSTKAWLQLGRLITEHFLLLERDQVGCVFETEFCLRTRLWCVGEAILLFVILPPFWYIVPRKIWQTCLGFHRIGSGLPTPCNSDTPFVYKCVLYILYHRVSCIFWLTICPHKIKVIKQDPWDRCYDFLNIFAEKFSKKIGVFDSKQR